MMTREEQAQLARESGLEARRKGRPASANPYDFHDPRHQGWRSGWEAGAAPDGVVDAPIQFKSAFDSSAWLGASFTSHALETLGNVAEEVARAYMRHREEKLWAAVMILENWRMPSNEEVARRGRRVIWPDGKTEWYWDKNLILTEPSPSERWRQGGLESPNS